MNAPCLFATAAHSARSAAKYVPSIGKKGKWNQAEWFRLCASTSLRLPCGMRC